MKLPRRRDCPSRSVRPKRGRGQLPKDGMGGDQNMVESWYPLQFMAIKLAMFDMCWRLKGKTDALKCEKKNVKLQKRKNTHTLLLRIANRNVKLEYILRAKQSGSKPDRKTKVQARFELPSSIVPLPHKWCTTITTITLKENWKLNLPFLVSTCWFLA